MCNSVGAVCHMLMTLTANAISSLIHIQRKFTDPRMARKVSCSGGDKAGTERFKYNYKIYSQKVGFVRLNLRTVPRFYSYARRMVPCVCA